MARPEICGLETPDKQFPMRLKGTVVKGFGRGSRELGIPTANFPESVVESECNGYVNGIYYGWASVGTDNSVYPMVMSLGWNPYYKNEKQSAEVHIIHEFPADFYGEELRVIVLGYIRPEKDYESVDALIADIRTDIRVAINSLNRKAYQEFQKDKYLLYNINETG